MNREIGKRPEAGDLVLISHHLCPYVQRVAIALAEKGTPFERVYVDLANRPDWFIRLSPMGKVPLLRTSSATIFESAVILEYLEDTTRPALHPGDPLRRADHRAWIEFGSAILNDIGGLYNAMDKAAFDLKQKQLEQRFARLEERLVALPWFDGEAFSLVDAVFAPVFRYFDTFDRIGEFGILAGKPRINRWRQALAGRPSVISAVTPDYPQRLVAFLAARNSHLSWLMATEMAA